MWTKSWRPCVCILNAYPLFNPPVYIIYKEHVSSVVCERGTTFSISFFFLLLACYSQSMKNSKRNWFCEFQMETADDSANEIRQLEAEFGTSSTSTTCTRRSYVGWFPDEKAKMSTSNPLSQWTVAACLPAETFGLIVSPNPSIL